MTGICPFCFKVVRLTKGNTCYRHGYRSYARNRNWRGEFLGGGFGMVETKSACPGGGKPPNTASTRLGVRQIKTSSVFQEEALILL